MNSDMKGSVPRSLFSRTVFFNHVYFFVFFFLPASHVQSRIPTLYFLLYVMSPVVQHHHLHEPSLKPLLELLFLSVDHNTELEFPSRGCSIGENVGRCWCRSFLQYCWTHLEYQTRVRVHCKKNKTKIKQKTARTSMRNLLCGTWFMSFLVPLEWQVCIKKTLSRCLSGLTDRRDWTIS